MGYEALLHQSSLDVMSLQVLGTRYRDGASCTGVSVLLLLL